MDEFTSNNKVTLPTAIGGIALALLSNLGSPQQVQAGQNPNYLERDIPLTTELADSTGLSKVVSTAELDSMIRRGDKVALYIVQHDYEPLTFIALLNKNGISLMVRDGLLEDSLKFPKDGRVDTARLSTPTHTFREYFRSDPSVQVDTTLASAGQKLLDYGFKRAQDNNWQSRVKDGTGYFRR